MGETSGPGAMLRAIVLCCAVLLPVSAAALETTLTAPGAPEELTERLTQASGIMSARARGLDTAQEILAAALSDYNTLVQVLYDEGYFGPVVNIRIDGREAASIEPLNAPSRIGRVDITVRPGAPFRFGRTRIAPLSEFTEMPESFAPGQPASTGALQDATREGIRGWRRAGHAKAQVGSQRIVADHRSAVLDADIEMLPGPQLTFGTMAIQGESQVRRDAIYKMAGFPTGEVFSPDKAARVATRLRRSGAFRSVTVKEADRANPDGTLDYVTTVIDMPQRRISFGAELSSDNGVDLSAKWTHRNLFGAAERLQLEATVRNLGGQEDIDGRIGARLDRPATLGPDDRTFYVAEIERRDRTHYSLTRALVGFGARRTFSDELYVEASLNAGASLSDDAFGDGRKFQLITLPIRAEWDKRNDKVNATDGFYVDALVTPLTGFSETESALQIYVDGRGYLGLGPSDAVVLAGRLQFGSVLGAGLPNVSPEYLFFSGGAGTVRGQPYESLGIVVPGGANTGIAGGKSLLALAAEIRGRLTEKLSLVGFYDFGAVDAESIVDGSSPSHSGAGLGVRYDLGGFGPLRLDLAYPVSGSTSDGLQFYIGIGQAF